jgi:hypothetical protein
MATKKSPRAPAIALDEAIKRATKIYEKEKRNAAPSDVIAQDLGYKSANNGAALQTIASLRYYGLLERPRDGFMAVTKEVESYLYAPTDAMKHELLVKWLSTPTVFATLLKKFSDGLPSDATLRFDLIGQGFIPASAEALLVVFKRSLEFVQQLTGRSLFGATDEIPAPNEDVVRDVPTAVLEDAPRAPQSRAVLVDNKEDDDADKIPIRLSKGRRAWLIIPSPFFEKDKDRLKSHIDLLLTDDDDKEN